MNVEFNEKIDKRRTMACNMSSVSCYVNPTLMGTLKPQSNGPLYSNMVIGTLAVDGWAVNVRSHRRRFVPDFKIEKVATKSQFIMTILVHPSSS